MKSLCITGSAQRTLDLFAGALREAGAKAAIPALRKEKLSIAQWHQKVVATQANSGSSGRLKPGRTWDQMAVDIFYANDKFPLWFWAEESSVKVLNYWLEFDTATQFVFVHTPPLISLASAIAEGNNTLLALEKLLRVWCERTQAMLSVHLSHPERCVFIEGPLALSNPAAHITALAEHWQLPLEPSQASPLEATADNALERYLISNLLQRYPHAIELHNEVRARLLATSLTTTVETPLIVDQVLAALSGKNSALEAATSAHRELEKRLQKSEEVSLETKVDGAMLLKQLAAEHAKAIQLIDVNNSKSLQKLKKENAKALLDSQHQSQIEIKALKQLHSALSQEKLALQSKLDTYVVERHHKLETIKQAQAETLIENELLLNQLHYTQEDLEQYITLDRDLQAELQQMKYRIQKILQRIPNYWEVEDITTQAIGAPGQTTIQWQLTNVYLNNYLIPSFSFQSRLSNGGAEILIQRSAKTGAGAGEEWIRWPSELADSKEFPCMPTAGGPYAGNNAILSRLSTSGWARLLLLIKNLITHLESSTDIKLPERTDKKALLAGFKRLLATLANWPVVFRFDEIQLIGNDRSNGYQALGIRLSNLSLGQHSWAELEYRVSTVDQNPSLFGENPRLEFHESSRAALQNWFAESQDSKGKKLELRFAKPDAMDVDVWKKLSETDRLLIAGLVGNLPVQLDLLKKNNLTLLLPWQDWLSLSKSLREILAKNPALASKRIVADVERTDL